MNNYKLSIVSSSYNDSQYGIELYESIKPKLVCDEIEWIIVDDGSKEKHFKRLQQIKSKSKNIQLLQQSNLGPAKARDLGIENANSTYCLVVDIDDVCNISGIEDGLQFLKNNSTVDILVGDCKVFFEENDRKEYWSCGPISIKGMLNTNQWVVSNIFTKQLWKKVGGFSTSKDFAREDYLFWLKCIALNAKIDYLNKAFIYYRRKRSNSRNKKRRSYEDRLLFHRAAYKHQKLIVNQYIRSIEKKYMLSMVQSSLGYYELQSGKGLFGLVMLLKSIINNPFNFQSYFRIVKAPLKRTYRLITRKEI